MGVSGGIRATGFGGRRTLLVDLVLAGGYLALACGVAAAYLSPARTYELSIYAATPAAFWFGVGLAMLSALVVTVGIGGRSRLAGLGLAGGAFTAVAALPLIRGYHFYGSADALTHLGYLRDIASGATSVERFFYPGVHTLALAIGEGTGFSQERALLFVVFVTAVVFVLFVPLTVRALVDADLATTLGVFAAVLFLPINHVATHYMEAHSMSETVLLFPLVLYLLVVYLESDQERAVGTPIGGLLALVTFATVLYHPLQATVELILFATVAGMQFLCRRYRPTHPIATHRRVYGQTAFLAVSYGLWTLVKPRFLGTADIVLGEVWSFLSGSGAQAGAVVGQQSESLAAVGSGLGDLFVKLFLVAAIFAAFAALLSVRTVYARFEVPETGREYLVAALVAFVPATLFLFVGSVSKLAFRLVGSIMVVATVLGTVWLYRLAADRSSGRASRPMRFALVVILGAMVLHSLAIVYASPHIHKATPHVTEAQLSGYETAFEMGSPGVAYAGIRGGADRYMQAIYGADSVPESLQLEYHQQRGSITGENLTRIDARYDEDRYLVVSDRAVERELGPYRSIRYDRSQLASIHSQRQVHRIGSNGVFRLYRYDADR